MVCECEEYSRYTPRCVCEREGEGSPNLGEVLFRTFSYQRDESMSLPLPPRSCFPHVETWYICRKYLRKEFECRGMCIGVTLTGVPDADSIAAPEPKKNKKKSFNTDRTDRYISKYLLM